MKKYNLYLWLIALVGLFASCSQDETDALQTANESNRVTLTASLPADFAQPGTRANEVPAFPTDHKLRCILEVWDEQLTTLKVRKEVCPSAGAAKIDFTFELDNGKYNALLWADYISESTGASSAAIAGLSGVEHYTDKYYQTNNAAGLKEVQVVSMLPDFESRDAFCAAKPFTKEAAALKDLTATLTRPLTKLTIAEKNATNFGYCRAVLTRYSVPDKLNVSTGTVSGSEPIVLTYNSGVPGFGDDITVNDTPCKVLFSNYIFAQADGTMPEINLEFTATAESGKVLPKVTIPAGIPVKRNHRINAAGTLIVAQDVPSKAVNMSVDINSGWAEPDENKDIVPVVEAKVGNYYYADGTWSTALDATKTCIGIVFQTAPARIGTKEKEVLAAKGVTEPHGLVMALKNAATSAVWSSEDYDFSELTNCKTKEECAADISGLYNYTTVITYAEQGNKLASYPAFKAVKEYSVTAPAKTTGWYLPSVGQWYDFFANLGGLPGWESAQEDNDNPLAYDWSGPTELVNKVNAYFSSLGSGNYDAFIPTGSEQNLWSSSEYSTVSARYWKMNSNGSVGCRWSYKDGNSFDVRPVLAF